MARTISEQEFRAIEDYRKSNLADLIQRSGLPYKRIAYQTGVGRKVVKRAAECEGIRYDSATRLEYYLENYFSTLNTKID